MLRTETVEKGILDLIRKAIVSLGGWIAADNFIAARSTSAVPATIKVNLATSVHGSLQIFAIEKIKNEDRRNRLPGAHQQTTRRNTGGEWTFRNSHQQQSGKAKAY
jgi:hypothetical protein